MRALVKVARAPGASFNNGELEIALEPIPSRTARPIHGTRLISAAGPRNTSLPRLPALCLRRLREVQFCGADVEPLEAPYRARRVAVRKAAAEALTAVIKAG